MIEEKKEHKRTVPLGLLWDTIGGLTMFYELLKTRRSIRKYQDRAIEKEKIDKILNSALMSPSSKSRRPWEFIAVTDRELLQKLSKVRERGSLHIADAPLCIVVCADAQSCDVWAEDASITSIIIQLAAHSLGLGSCWVQARERFGAQGEKTGDIVKELLNIPQKFEIECLIAIGYPAEEKPPHEEGGLKTEKLHYNGWQA